MDHDAQLRLLQGVDHRQARDEQRQTDGQRVAGGDHPQQQHQRAVGQPAATDEAQQDGDYGGALHQAVGLHQSVGAAQLGQDAVFGWGVDGGADAG